MRKNDLPLQSGLNIQGDLEQSAPGLKSSFAPVPNSSISLIFQDVSTSLLNTYLGLVSKTIWSSEFQEVLELWGKKFLSMRFKK